MSNNYNEVYSLHEQAFEWLDMAEEFFKHDGSFSYGEDRNANVTRAGEKYNDIEAEYRQLERMYEVAPEHVVEPLMPVYRNGEMAGFYMERVDGELLKDYLLNTQNREEIRKGLDIVEEVESVIEELHDEDIVHGDLTNNIIYDGENFKFFDPVGTPKDREGFNEMKQWDQSTPQRLNNNAKHPLQEVL